MDSPKNTTPGYEEFLSDSDILDSIQVIYGEILKAPLLVQVIRVLVDISNAYRVIFYSVKKDKLFIEAENNPGTTKCILRDAFDVSRFPEKEKKKYFLTVINDVVQAREPVSIENSGNSNRYSSDAYISAKNPKAVLCLPMIYDRNFTGVIYFEYDKGRTFSNELIEKLFVIVRHIGISFGHSELYNTEIVNRKTRQKFLNSLFESDLGTSAEKVIDRIIDSDPSAENMDWNDFLDSIKAEEWYWEYMSKTVMLKIKNEELKRSLKKIKHLNMKKTESLVSIGNEIKITLNGLRQMLDVFRNEKKPHDKRRIVHSMLSEIDTLKNFVGDVFKRGVFENGSEIVSFRNENGSGGEKIKTGKEDRKEMVLEEDRNVLSHYDILNDDIPMDYEQAIVEFEGSEPFLIEVLEGFIYNVEKQVLTIKDAIEEKDFETILKEASSIKGGADNLTAWNLSVVSRELEMMAASKSVENADELINLLEKEFHRFKNFAIRKAQLYCE